MDPVQQRAINFSNQEQEESQTPKSIKLVLNGSRWQRNFSINNSVQIGAAKASQVSSSAKEALEEGSKQKEKQLRLSSLEFSRKISNIETKHLFIKCICRMTREDANNFCDIADIIRRLA
jgi:hypothetical protein